MHDQQVQTGVKDGSSGTAGRVSVIVPCRNEVAHLGTFLSDLRAQRLPPGHALEVIVADGMSDDGTRGVLQDAKRSHPWLRIVDNPGRIVSTGLNRALEWATGDVIVRMDVHTRYADDYILECVRAIETTGADVVGGPWIAEGYDRRTRAIAAAFRSPFGMGGGKHRADYEGPLDTVYLGAWRRSTLHDLGGFDVRMVRTQDAELNRRIRHHGGVVWQTPRIRSRYHPRSSFRELFLQFLRYGYWKARLLQQDPGETRLRHMAPGILVLGLAAGVAALPLAGPWLLLATACTYLVVNLAASFASVRGADSPVLVPLVALAFLTFHVSYGLGSIRGFLSRRPSKSPSGDDGARRA